MSKVSSVHLRPAKTLVVDKQIKQEDDVDKPDQFKPFVNKSDQFKPDTVPFK